MAEQSAHKERNHVTPHITEKKEWSIVDGKLCVKGIFLKYCCVTVQRLQSHNCRHYFIFTLYLRQV